MINSASVKRIESRSIGVTVDLDHAIFWQVYPLGALGAPIRPGMAAPGGRTLADLVPWLDYARDLGCNGLLLGPIFASTSHGYDTLDHFRIDPRLGEEADFDRLVAEAHQRGFSVVLDGVFNHVGLDHPLVGPAREGAGMVRVQDGYVWTWEGHPGLAELDHSDPRVADLVVDVMCHWLGRGADGWRLDVAYAVPSEFWATVLTRVRAKYPDVFVMGEVIHGEYGQIARAGTLDAVTQYELWKAIWSSLRDRNLWELAWSLERHNSFGTETRLQTFVGNHDVERIASTVGDGGAALAAAILLTVPGIPSVYYGDEQAFRGVKASGDASDDPLRPALPATPAELSALGSWLYRHYQELIALRRRHPWVSRGSVEVGQVTNETLVYRVSDGSHRMDVRLDLDRAPQVSILVNGASEFAWSAPALA